MAKLQNMFEEAYQGFHLEIYELVQGMCTFVIRKNDVKSLTISDDYKLVTEKMEEIKEVHKLTEEALGIQKKSLTYICVSINRLWKPPSLLLLRNWLYGKRSLRKRLFWLFTKCL